MLIRNWIIDFRLYFLNKKVNRYFQDQNFQEVLKYTEKIWRIIGDSPELVRTESLCYFYQDDIINANEVLNEGLSIFPEDVELLYLKATYLESQKKLEEGIEITTELIKREPLNHDYLALHAYLLMSIKEYDKAIDFYMRVLSTPESLSSINTEDVEILDNDFYATNDYGVLNNLGFARLHIGEYHKAIGNFNRVIEIKADFAYAYNNRGFAFMKLGHLDKAIVDIEKSLELDSENSYAYKNKALYYLELGNKQAALVNLGIAKELGYTKQYDSEVVDLIAKIRNES